MKKPVYIYQHNNWEKFSWDFNVLQQVFGDVRRLQGEIAGQMSAVGFSMKGEANLAALTQDVLKSSEIEGELLNHDQVRSSIAKRLGIDIEHNFKSNRHIEGVVAMMMDAVVHCQLPLTKERLLGWHASLFPTGFSGLYTIEAGKYRKSPVQIVSGAMGKEKVHYEAIPPEKVKKEMEKFLRWLNEEDSLDPIFKAALAHFRFVIIHPFDDGNGRIARAITDMILTQAEGGHERYYSMSAQIMKERKQYYEVLKRVQHSSGDITEWLLWFMHCLKNALLETKRTLASIFQKTEFWKMHEETALNSRQRKVLNRMFDGFQGKMQSSKWAKIAKCSSDTALRDIRELVELGILVPEGQGGRSTSYRLNEF